MGKESKKKANLHPNLKLQIANFGLILRFWQNYKNEIAPLKSGATQIILNITRLKF